LNHISLKKLLVFIVGNSSNISGKTYTFIVGEQVGSVHGC